MAGVDHHVDIRKLPFDDRSYDVVFASHVLEHIREDRLAFLEIRRILSPAGIAILPVPIYGEFTREYDTPNPLEHGHVRAPGVDYFGKYDIFTRYDLYSSGDFPERHQTYLKMIGKWERHWPSKPSFLREDGSIKVMPDFVPVFFA
jgi:ubiquinone/menaquinone biosynthesis C-methylase UbiE